MSTPDQNQAGAAAQKPATGLWPDGHENGPCRGRSHVRSYPQPDWPWVSAVVDFAGLWIMRRFVAGLFDILPAPGAGLPQTVAFAVHLQDMDVVRETIEQRTGQPFGAKDARPILKGQVRGHDDRAALVPLAEYLE